MSRPLLGLGCGCCGPGGCAFRVNVIMSDSMPMDESGVAITLVVRDDDDNIVLTEGPVSPDTSAIQVTHAATAGVTYTAELTVEQEGGPTCTFTREFTAPTPCNGPFSVSLFIPRVWVRLLDCGPCDHAGACGQAMAVAGPDDFAMSGTSGEYPDPPPIFWGDFPRDLCRFKFTPCSEGEYVVTGSSGLSNVQVIPFAIEVEWVDPIAGPFDAAERLYFMDVSSTAIKPAPGYVWPGGCANPAPAVLHMTGTSLGSATLTADDGECEAIWTGEGSITLPTCDGDGTEDVAITWTLRPIVYASFGVTEWYWELTGTTDGICWCLVPGEYGQCVWMPRAGSGPGFAGGSMLRGTTTSTTPFLSLCEDCSAIDLSIPVSLAPLSPAGGGLNCERETSPVCSLPAKWGSVGDLMTITP